MTMKVQEAYRTPNRLNKIKSTLTILIILRATKEKGQVTYKGRSVRITPDFSTETLKARRSWTDVLQTKRSATTPSKAFNHHRWRK